MNALELKPSYWANVSGGKDTEKAIEKKTGKKHSIFQGNPKYNSEYVDHNVRTKWLPIFKERMGDHGTV